MTLWRWHSWTGDVREFDAQFVQFLPDHVVFMDDDTDPAAVLLAVQNSDVSDLHPADAPPPWRAGEGG